MFRCLVRKVKKRLSSWLNIKKVNSEVYVCDTRKDLFTFSIFNHKHDLSLTLAKYAGHDAWSLVSKSCVLYAHINRNTTGDLLVSIIHTTITVSPKCLLETSISSHSCFNLDWSSQFSCAMRDSYQHNRCSQFSILPPNKMFWSFNCSCFLPQLCFQISAVTVRHDVIMAKRI